MTDHSYRPTVRPTAAKIAAIVAALIINVSFVTALFEGGQSDMYRTLEASSEATHGRAA